LACHKDVSGSVTYLSLSVAKPLLDPNCEGLLIFAIDNAIFDPVIARRFHLVAFSMNSLAAVTAVVFALTAEAAFAQNSPESLPPSGPSPVSLPAQPWSGFHVGLDGGYAWDPNIYTASIPLFADFDNQEINDFGAVYSGITHSQASALSATGVTHPNVSGFFGGGQVGYDHQFGSSFVAGVEADVQGAGIRGRGGFVGAASTSFIELPAGNSCSLEATDGAGCIDTVTSHVQNEKSINWIGTARARFGYLAMPTVLVYATGGLAYGGVSAQTSISQSWSGHTILLSPGADGHISNTRVGWTIGGGFEWLFSPNWSVKFEGLYYDLGTVRFASGPLQNTSPTSEFAPAFPNATNTLVSTTHTRFYGDVFRVGLNYHF
jgi:outer membrane immunogenic protein